MCILFFTIDDNPSKQGYKLILANNRDEIWDRPTKPAAFWDDNPECISGIDLDPSRDRGTWLGMSRQGRVASLLNILQVDGPELNKKGRGCLVWDYIAGDIDAASYIQQLNHEAYNGFNLLLLEIGMTEPSKVFYTTNMDDSLKLEVFPTGTYGFGNSTLNRCWKKAKEGKAIFSEIVKNYGTVDKKNELVDSLTQLLSDKMQYLPDPYLEEQGRKLPETLKKERSGIFVFSPEFRYGTRLVKASPGSKLLWRTWTREHLHASLPSLIRRTHTIILIDSEGNCEYIEKTLKTPVDENNFEWIISKYSFPLKV